MEQITVPEGMEAMSVYQTHQQVSDGLARRDQCSHQMRIFDARATFAIRHLPGSLLTFT